MSGASGSPDVVELNSFCGGVALGVAGWIERHNPSRRTESVGRVSTVSVEQAGSVVDAGHAAFVEWSAIPAPQRLAWLTEAAAAVEASATELGPLLARELGKVVGDCRGEMGFAAAYLRYCIDAYGRVAVDRVVDDRLGRLTVTHVPFGVCIAIVPWNAPLILSILKVAPALVAGNTVVVKPSPIAPLAVTAALGLLAAQLPPGVLSVVHGDGDVGAALVGHPRTAKVAFTGGGAVAHHVLASAATQLTPVVLELGGNDPAVFLDDAPFDDETMERAVFGTFLTSGQVCMAAKRLYVPAPRHDEFVEAYRAAADRVLVVGDPLDPQVTIGPMATEQQRSFVQGLVDRAVGSGAVAHELGRVRTDVDLDAGWFLRPTVLTGVAPSAEVVQVEQFGPTVPVVPYDDVDQAIAWANEGDLGLASSVWSADEDRAFEVARRIEAGMTFINCHNRAGMSLRAPFGGVKRSGFGREFADDGLAEYLQTHSIHAPAAVRAGGPSVAPNAYPGALP